MSTDCPPNFHRGQNSIESSKGPIGNSVFINGQIKGRLHLMFGIYPKKLYLHRFYHCIRKINERGYKNTANTRG